MAKYTICTTSDAHCNFADFREKQKRFDFVLPDSYKEDGAPFAHQHVQMFVLPGNYWEGETPLDHARNVAQHGWQRQDKQKARQMITYLLRIAERDNRERLLARREKLLFELLEIDKELDCAISDDNVPVDCYIFGNTPRARKVAESAAE
jgi:hypothetical protein